MVSHFMNHIHIKNDIDSWSQTICTHKASLAAWINYIMWEMSHWSRYLQGALIGSLLCVYIYDWFRYPRLWKIYKSTAYSACIVFSCIEKNTYITNLHILKQHSLGLSCVYFDGKYNLQRKIKWNSSIWLQWK